MPAFSSLNLSPAMLANLSALGYAEPTAIQAASVPPILAGRDVLAQAKTGSGKTAAFGIGLLERLALDRPGVQALVLCPTRELAAQVARELRRVARFQANVKVVTITGGAPLRRQEQSLSHPPQVVVGTPGRVQALLRRGSLVLDTAQALVLDEADRMLDMGFIDQIQAIVRHLPQRRQTLCFSATLPDGVQALAASVLREPDHVAVDRQHAAGVIEHAFFSVAEADKAQATLALLAQHQPESALVFCNTKAQCRAVRDALDEAGVACLAFHGDLDQHQRTLVMVRFGNGSCPVLVATDVAARGLDVQGLDAVINHDLPFKPEVYVHRVGRTGRAGATGHAFSLVTPGQGPRVQAISEALGRDFRSTPAALQAPGRPTKAPAMVTLSLNGGRKAKLSAGDILGALTAKGGVPGAAVGKIDRMDQVTFVAVRRAEARAALRVLRAAPIKRRRYRVTLHD